MNVPKDHKTTSISKVFIPTTTSEDFRLVVSIYAIDSILIEAKAYYDNELPFYNEQITLSISRPAKYIVRFPNVPVTDL